VNQPDQTSGTVTGVNGNMIAVHVPTGTLVQNEVAYLRCCDERLKAEVIKIRGQTALLQLFEDPRGVQVGQQVEFSGELLSVELGPGLLGMIYAGLQNPLKLLDNRQGFFLRRGQYLPALDRQRSWSFHPTVRPGDTVQAGSWLGWVQEHHCRHQILAPVDLQGLATVERIVPPGDQRVDDQVAVLRAPFGRLRPVPLWQSWPVKRAFSAHAERLYPEEQLVTGVRLIDTFFPVARGGVACIPGPFGAGKTVLQHLLAKFAQVDVVVVVACGERAGEVVETITTFPEMEDPKTGGSLMDRTILICNTSSMPVASRDASVYTGVTLAEYYRAMGLDVLLLADSTSRWAQAMREMSGRLEEIPGEEAFPAYLESRVAGLYERAGLVRLHSGATGALTLIGTVSPAGGNFEEPVTQATLKVVSAFLGLSRKRSDERRFPAIDPLESWSLYLRQLEPFLDRRLAAGWVAKVGRASRLLRRAAEISRMITVVGEEGISLEDLIEMLLGELVDAVYLQQNAFDPVDRANTIERQGRDFLLLSRALDTAYSFTDKPAARAYFARLQDAFYQKNYLTEETAEHGEAVARVERLLAEGAGR